jgi:RNA polymerase sigma-B factor
LIERLLPLVQAIARRYEHRGEPLEDLVQAGSVGLVKAVDRFDPERGVTLSTFAVPNIAGEIKRHFRDATRTIRVPRDVQELRSEVMRATDRMAVNLGRFPTVAEIADVTGATSEDVVEALQSGHAYRPESLHEPVGEDEEMLALIGGVDENFARADARLLIDSGLDVLDQREVRILRMRFSEDMTQTEIAKRVGVSQMHVSRLIRRSVNQLRKQIDTEDSSAN